MSRFQRSLALLTVMAFSLSMVAYHYGISSGLLRDTALSRSWSTRIYDSHRGQNPSGTPPPESLTSLDRQHSREKILGIFTQVLVVSRPGRLDRRAIMERLRLALDIPWSYIDAISHDEPVVPAIMDCVKSVRRRTQSRTFQWPSDFASGDPVRPSPESSRSRLLSEPTCFPPFSPLSDAAPSHVASASTSSLGDKSAPYTSTTSAHSMTDKAIPPGLAPLTCAREDQVQGVTFRPLLPSYMRLTSAKIACWYSHLAAIQRVVDFDRLGQHNDVNQSLSTTPHNAFLVLEDDVDMEQDIATKLRRVWGALPEDWDVVFLGHCWSNESYHPALIKHSTPSSVALHPSFAPKCTHAYAINPASARRLRLHLTYPPFAYSRALDQALAWLVESKRVKAFSIVPSLVIQHKGSGSDIDQGVDGAGSRWRERLQHSVLGL